MKELWKSKVKNTFDSNKIETEYKCIFDNSWYYPEECPSVEGLDNSFLSLPVRTPAGSKGFMC
ncbi:hypothetical protein ACFL40_06335 [candidate division KSB1 bacterium]